MVSIILTVFIIVVAYGFGFFSGSIAMAEKNADIHNEERKKACIHFNTIK
tara:strand:+ start:206 stop:355 length:150 start_codon:yes stop_codon:yes gene_type:complete